MRQRLRSVQRHPLFQAESVYAPLIFEWQGPGPIPIIEDRHQLRHEPFNVARIGRPSSVAYSRVVMMTQAAPSLIPVGVSGSYCSVFFEGRFEAGKTPKIRVWTDKFIRYF